MSGNTDLSDIRSLVEQRVPQAPKDLLVYVMGAYTTSSPDYHLRQSNSTVAQALSKVPLFKNIHAADPIFEYADQSNSLEDALHGVAAHIRSDNQLGHRAFLATDVDVPTETQAQEDPVLPNDAGVDPLTQSLFYAAISNAVVFVFSEAGVNDGVASELSGIAMAHNLDQVRPQEAKKPPCRFMYLHHSDVGSATLSEFPANISLVEGSYSREHDIHGELVGWLRQIEQMDSPRTENDDPIHRFSPDELTTDLSDWDP